MSKNGSFAQFLLDKSGNAGAGCFQSRGFLLKFYISVFQPAFLFPDLTTKLTFAFSPAGAFHFSSMPDGGLFLKAVIASSNPLSSASRARFYNVILGVVSPEQVRQDES